MMRATSGCRPVAALLLVAVLVVGIGGLTAASAGAPDDTPRLADYFGFQPLEVYKLDTRIREVQTRDLDGDHTDDILVVNNARSRIDLLLSRKKAAADPAVPPFLRREVNQVENDRRMRLESVPVNRAVVSMVTGDFNGDGKPDIAFYGTPAELVVLYNDGEGRFDSATARRINTGEAVESSVALTTADVNRDGRADLALLAANELVLVYQDDKGRLGEPERVPHTSSAPQMLRAADIDGDGGDDLLILDGGNDDPARIRFSAPGGKLGPEQRFRIEAPRAITLAKVDNRPGAELLTIEGQSGRVKVLTLDAADDDGAQRGRLIVYPLPPGTERGRTLALGDLDGDGRPDVVVSDPANAQFLVFRQGEKGGLGTFETFPGLVGGTTVRLADLDGDRKAEVVVLSQQEKQIGRSVLADGRLTFPAPLPTSGEPVALETADLDGDAHPEVVYVSHTTRPNAGDEFVLRALKREKSGSFVPFRWGTVDGVTLQGLANPPSGLKVVDVNRDGQPDILLFNAFGAPTLLLGRTGGEPPAPAQGSLGPLAGATPASLTVAELEGPALVVAQNSFARQLLLDRSGIWTVKDQFNTGRSSAQIVGATALDTDGDGVREVVLCDKASKSLLYLAKKEGVYRPAGTLSLGAIDFQGMQVADLDGDGRDDLLIAGTDRFGVVLTGRKGQQLRTLASYESSRPEARLADLIVADLNGDGHPDVAVTDVAEHFIELVSFAGTAGLQRGLAFKVFERKSFRGGLDALEPHDMTVGDVDGDGRTDLILLVHDRVLVYRQDPGPAKPTKPAAGK